VSTFDLPGALRRIRRRADMSQRELAAAAGVSASAVGHAETGKRDPTVRALAGLATLAGLRLTLVDEAGDEVAPMTAETVRDMANRRFPAHLDTRYGDDGWWHGPHRYDREQPWYTFDRDRSMRDRYRRRDGTPDDHQLPQAGDSPADRAAARKREYWRARAEEREQRFLAGGFSHIDVGFTCTCPSACDELDIGEPRCTRPDARVRATSAEPLLPWGCARQPPAYEPRRGPLLGRPPRRGFRAYPAPLTAPSELSPARARGATP
jgi:transcriptional regulator with XRE-family HTH domain